MYYSKERDKLVDFSIPHNIIKYSIFTRKNSRIKLLSDLTGKEIIVMRDAFSYDFLMQKGIAGKIVPVEDTPTALRLLSSGKHDCALLVRIQGLYFMKKFKIKNVKAGGEPFHTVKFCFAVREGDSILLARLNEGLFVIKETGKYDEIYNKWFGILGQEAVSLRQILRYGAFILTPILMVLLAPLFWAKSLKHRVKIKTGELTHELSERRKAEEALRANRDYLEKLTNSMWDAVFSVKIPERVIEWANDSFRLIGYEPSECIGKDTAFLYPDKDDFLDFGNKLEDAMAAGKDVFHTERLLKRKSGETFPAEITVT